MLSMTKVGISSGADFAVDFVFYVSYGFALPFWICLVKFLHHDFADTLRTHIARDKARCEKAPLFVAV